MNNKNIFRIGEEYFREDIEKFEDLFNNNNLRIERIVSEGHITDENTWLQELKNEWVLLLQGNAIIIFENGDKFELKTGNYLFIPSNMKHRVTYTSVNPKCIWLAIHF